MNHLLYLMFRCDENVMESLESWEEFGVSKDTPKYFEMYVSPSVSPNRGWEAVEWEGKILGTSGKSTV